MRGKRRVQRSYSPEEKAEALRQLVLNNGNLSETVKETGIPTTSLRHWQDEQLRGSMAPQAKEIEKFIQDSWKNILMLSKPAYIKRFKASLLEKGDLKGIAQYISIMLDKIMALIRGQLLTGGSKGSKEKPLGELSDEEIEKLSEEELERLIQEEEAKEKKKKEGG